MPPNKPDRFHDQVIDVLAQIEQLGIYRNLLLEANTISELDGALEALEDSVRVLQASVTGLKYKVGLAVEGPK